MNFKGEFYDLKDIITSKDQLDFNQYGNKISMTGNKLFTMSSDKKLGWGVNFMQEIDGQVKKVSMCGQINIQNVSGKEVVFNTNHEV